MYNPDRGAILASALALGCCILNAASVAGESGIDVESGALAKLSTADFVRRYIPNHSSAKRIRAVDFIKGRTHSEAIESAIATAGREQKREPLRLTQEVVP